jgi:hypothetical protein
MTKSAVCWAIRNYEFTSCPHPSREFTSVVSLHTHSNHSIERMRPLESVMARWYMWPLRAIVRRAFGLQRVPDLTYADLWYNPPYPPEEVLRMETEAAGALGFDSVQLAITDHDEIAGSVELRQRRPSEAQRISLGEELSLRFEGHLFHLGITGLPSEGVAETHAAIQAAAHAGRVDEVFEILQGTHCLVVLNHPLIPWTPNRDPKDSAQTLLKRYGQAIDALEFNGMRGRDENDRVLELARYFKKPVVGGGDSHLLLASSTLSGSGADSYAGFVEEVKSGQAVPVVKSDYFAPVGWKLFLRTFYFMAHYRQICHFRGEPVAEMLKDRPVLLDPVGRMAQAFLSATSALGLAR